MRRVIDHHLSAKLPACTDHAAGALSEAVKSARHIHFARALVASVLFCAWFVATNHCALGLMNPASAEEHEHCPGHDSPAKSDDSGESQLACCKTIHAAPVPGKIAVDPARLLVELQLLVVAVLEPARVEKPLPSEAFDTGPPFVVSFAESVLQRSLLGHAPPLV